VKVGILEELGPIGRPVPGGEPEGEPLAAAPEGKPVPAGPAGVLAGVGASVMVERLTVGTQVEMVMTEMIGLPAGTEEATGTGREETTGTGGEEVGV